MNLTLFFRLILLSIFQDSGKKYNRQLFYAPKVFAKDGMNISLQINCANYCCSENGYRELGHTMIDVEFGFPEKLNSKSEALIAPYGECNTEGDVVLTSDVGKIPIEILEQVFEIHGGIDWEKTISIESFNKFVKF